MTDSASTYTKLPNWIIEAMPTLGNAELRVLLAIARKTIGHQKERDRISVSQIVDMTGLTSRNAQHAVTALLEKGLIERETAGKQTFYYTLNTISPRDTDQNHVPSDPMSLRDTEPYPLGTQLEVKPYPLGTTQKKDLKEKRKNMDASADHNSFFVTVAEACRVDLSLCTDRQKGQIAQAVKKLTKAGKTPEEIPKVLDYWYTIDWRGKKGDAPRPDQLIEVWHPATTHEAHANGHRNGSHIRQGTRNPAERGKLSEADPERGF